MNVYDFDGTIFYSDCSIGFAFWCMKRHPILWFTYFPGVLISFIKHKRGMIPNPKLSMNYTRSLPIMVFIFPSVRSRHLNI